MRMAARSAAGILRRLARGICILRLPASRSAWVSRKFQYSVVNGQASSPVRRPGSYRHPRQWSDIRSM